MIAKIDGIEVPASKKARSGLKGARRAALTKAAPYYNPSPLTAEMDYQPDEIAFMRAISGYQNKTGKKFPTWCEVLKVVKELGYIQPS